MRPLSHHGEKQFVAGHTDRQNFGFEANTEDNKMTSAGWPDAHINGWFQDVIELRKKAGEYKCRGWGAEMQPEMLSKQKELWDQVSRRSSLSALSLASATARYVRTSTVAVVLGRTPSRNANVCCCSHACRPITKEEKEVENNKKSSPTKTSQVHFVGDNKLCDNVTNRLYSVRHHLERTTGPGKMGFGFPKWRKREQSLPPFLWLLLLLAVLYAQTSRRAPYCHHQRVKN